MKNKIFTAILAIVFIIILILCNSLLQKQNTEIVVDNKNNINIENQNLTNNEEENNMRILKVSNENFESEVLKSDKTVLIDFYADWCGPCKMLSPIVEQFAKEHSDIKVVKINIDDNQDLAVKYGVVSIPTLIVIKNGEESNRIVGLVSKSEIEKIIY